IRRARGPAADECETLRQAPPIVAMSAPRPDGRSAITSDPLSLSRRAALLAAAAVPAGRSWTGEQSAGRTVTQRRPGHGGYRADPPDDRRLREFDPCSRKVRGRGPLS